jgi:thymidylate synthase
MASTTMMATGFHQEHYYLNLIREIIRDGHSETGRNGNVRSLFGYMMRFSLKDGTWPLLTTKKVAWKTCLHELFWFLRGQTDNHILQDKGVHIWDDNGSREFLDSRGLLDRKEGDLGPVYGHQWRHFNAPYVDCHTDYSGNGIDQIKYVIDQLSNPETRTNRRLVVSAWNPQQLDEMALPPCHVLMQFYVRDGKYLSCSLYQRSGDVGLGVPFNIASYSALTHIIAAHCGLEAEEFVYFLGNAHIYENHLDALKEQVNRVPMEFPRIHVEKRDNIDLYDLDAIQMKTPYKHHTKIQMDMVA